MTIPPLTQLPTRVGTIPRTVALTMLTALYATLPRVACKGLCDDSCTQVGASQLERDRLTELGVHLTDLDASTVMADYKATGRIADCPALTPERRCSVYAVRPFLCRAFGVVSARGITGPTRFVQPMMCDHGCEPDATIDMTEFADIICRIEVLSRVATGIARGPLPGDSPALHAEWDRRNRVGGVPVATANIQHHRADAARNAAARRRKRR